MGDVVGVADEGGVVPLLACVVEADGAVVDGAGVGGVETVVELVTDPDVESGATMAAGRLLTCPSAVFTICHVNAVVAISATTHSVASLQPSMGP